MYCFSKYRFKVKLSAVLLSLLCLTLLSYGADLAQKEEWWVHPDFKSYSTRVVAVMPMDNLSLEPEVEKILYTAVYDRLAAKGYQKISVEKVNSVMKELGIQTPGMLDAFKSETLGKKLNCDAFLMGQIDQSADIHKGTYDAVVVSCSLILKSRKTSEIIWRTEQWRAAHRQWQLDPINAIINYMAHKEASREKRINWLVQEMLKTLPQGPIKIEFGDLLNKALEVKAQ